MIDQHEEGAVHLDIDDYNLMFRSLNQPPIFINEFDINDKDERVKLNTLIYTRYDSDAISNVPRCEGFVDDGTHLEGKYNFGKVCPTCNTRVSLVTEKPLVSHLWIEAPPGIPAFINPQVWRILSHALTYSGFNILEWLTNPKYRPNVPNPPILSKVAKLDLPPRGLKNFHDHYDAIMKILYLNRIFKGRTESTKSTLKQMGIAVPSNSRSFVRDKVYRFIQMNRHKTFTPYLPVPSKILFVTEDNNGTTYAAEHMTPAIDAIFTVIACSSKYMSQANKEEKTVKSISLWGSYYKGMEDKILFKKPGVFRKLVFGARPPWSFRSVISSQHGIHDYTKLALPWGLAILLFRSHISNKLLKRGYTPNEIMSFLYENVHRYNPVLDQIFKELIAESPGGKGIPTTFGRNPTLEKGSIQCFDIDEITTDPRDKTTKISNLCLKEPNADFDGDHMYGQLPLDNRYAAAFSRLRPHLYAMDLNKPFTVSSSLGTPGVVLSSTACWVEHGDEQFPIED